MFVHPSFASFSSKMFTTMELEGVGPDLLVVRAVAQARETAGAGATWLNAVSNSWKIFDVGVVNWAETFIKQIMAYYEIDWSMCWKSHEIDLKS